MERADLFDRIQASQSGNAERALTTAGYQVISVGHGEQASRLAREHAPDLILLDVMLPKMGGPDVLKVLKKDPATAAIPVMMLTGLSQRMPSSSRKKVRSAFSRSLTPC